MKVIAIGEELSEILNEYSDWFFNQDLDKLREAIRTEESKGFVVDKATSEPYLREVISKGREHKGYPEVKYCIDILMDPRAPEEQKKRCKQLNQDLCAYLGARNQAVNVYYPKDGFMGWHTNWNAAGYNILLSYTKNGGGYFNYRDPETDEIVSVQDTPGWSCKVGYFGKGSEPDKVYYHCAGSAEDRLTLGFVIPHLEIWRNMIEDISGEDATCFQ